MLTSLFGKTTWGTLLPLFLHSLIGLHILSMVQHNLKRKTILSLGIPHFFNDKTENKSSLPKGDLWCPIHHTARENKARMSSSPLSSRFRCILREKSLNFFSSNHQEGMGKTWNFWRQKCNISSSMKVGEEHGRVRDGFSAPDRYDLYGGISPIVWSVKHPLEPLWASNRF